MRNFTALVPYSPKQGQNLFCLHVPVAEQSEI